MWRSLACSNKEKHSSDKRHDPQRNHTVFDNARVIQRSQHTRDHDGRLQLDALHAYGKGDLSCLCHPQRFFLNHLAELIKTFLFFKGHPSNAPKLCLRRIV